MRWRRAIGWLREIRPLEWGVLAFGLFAVIRVGPRVLLAWRELAGLRTITSFFALGLVVIVDLVRRLRGRSWPDWAVGVRRMQRITFPIALVPMGVAAVVAFSSPALRREVESLRTADAIPLVATVLLKVIGVGLPTLVLWAGLGVHVKENDRLDIWGYLSGGVVRAFHVLRDWTPILIVLSAYAWMDAVVGGHLAPEQDTLMASIDRAMFGGVDPLDLLEKLVSTPLSEWMAFAYSSYAILYPLVLGAIFMFGGRAGLRETSFVLGFALLLGYVSYSIIPVKGPLLTRTFDVSLEYYLIGPVKEALMDATRVTWDCFPSMHTCCTMLMAWCTWRHARRLFWVILPVVVTMPFACVYLRYHYVIDVLVGLAVAAVMIGVTVKLRPWVVGDAEPQSAGAR